MANNRVLILELDVAEANFIREKNGRLKNVLAPQMRKEVNRRGTEKETDRRTFC